MISNFRARNYGCLVDVKASLTPLHAFIGPNDSGKSTLLHAMRTIVQLAGGHFSRAADGSLQPFDSLLFDVLSRNGASVAGNGASSQEIVLCCEVDGGEYGIRLGEYGLSESASHQGTEWGQPRERDRESELWMEPKEGTDFRPLLLQLRGSRLVRFDPDALREPRGLIPEAAPVSFLDDRGHGLAGVYFAIRNRRDDFFPTIYDDVRRYFPTIRNVRVKAVSSSEVMLEAELVDGQHVEAPRMSEGLLYYLAFVALQHLDPVSLLLVEEPENGLHPARIAEVVKILRAISEAGTQVVMATHSPLVVNELHPEEVSVVTRTPENGTVITSIKDTPNFELRRKAYALGELWLSYANGDDEAPLLEGGPRLERGRGVLPRKAKEMEEPAA